MQPADRFTGSEQALEALDRNPESVGFTPIDMLMYFGMTHEELLAELRGGRLVATGVRVKSGWRDILISAGAVKRWLSRDDLPDGMAERLYRHIKNKPTSH
jgi:hypothetical protein